MTTMIDRGAHVGTEAAEMRNHSFEQAILDALSAQVAVVDAAGTIVAVNASWNRFARDNGNPQLRGTGPGVNYLAVLSRVEGEDRPAAQEALNGITSVLDVSASEFVQEYACFTSDRQRWFSLSATPVGDGGAVVAHTEITARKLAEMEARAALEREAVARAQAEMVQRVLTVVVEQVPIGIIVVDALGQITLLNAAGRRIIGLPERDVPQDQRQLSDWMLYDPAERAPLPPDTHPLRRALSGDSVDGFEFLLNKLDGTGEVWVEEYAVPLRDSSGEITGALAVFADVTERRALEQQREDFISSAAHDLKGPLTAIKGFTQILQRQLARQGSLDADRAREPLAQVDRTASRLAAMIGELQDISSIRTGRPLRLTLTPTNASELVQRVVSQHEQVAPDHEFSLSMPERQVLARWDASRVERALTNLLSNAVKYSPEGTVISVSLRPIEGDAVEVEVSDQGIGIPEQDLARIFERFYRASNVTERMSGTGIGLVGVRQIVEQHGGSISVESREGEGSTFIVRLPLESPDAGVVVAERRANAISRPAR